ncbi:hypothetical protein [Limnochorda pilosa]|uniref:Glycosyl hydrolase n=1 Tax=Limnochorda pilosa TaxID=1555112 RepID=A0A0K2SM96_LIMPI|nr:hypothetical protein [Limnochorda pilosa]BAS28236.1 glycosyl hydrolase [Limnochorda pilosa]
MHIRMDLSTQDLKDDLQRFWDRSARSLAHLAGWDDGGPSPVVTVAGRYVPKAWTDWTRGFLYGSMLLHFEATGERALYDRARDGIRRSMPAYVTHRGVHDHGFNVISTYGALHRLALAGRLPAGEDREAVLRESEMALRASGAVQAMRWTRLPGPGALSVETADAPASWGQPGASLRAGSDFPAGEDDRLERGGAGYIHSFNGPHSLFIDTIRSLRSLAVADALGQRLHDEGDRVVDLLGRLLQHAWTSARYNVYYGEGRDVWDVPGRVCHEAVFSVADGSFRAPSTQQGYSPFTTWTRGLAWAILGFAEELQWLARLPEERLAPFGGRAAVLGWMERAARVTADYYLQHSFGDGIPLWDTGAPNVPRIAAYPHEASDPWNGHEPVDSSAAAIAAQGFLRLGRYLAGVGGPKKRVDTAPATGGPAGDSGQTSPEASFETEPERGSAGHRYWQAGLTLAATLFQPPYLNGDDDHQGLILHSIYHRPRGWDHLPAGSAIPAGESSLWGDYHARELALYLWCLLEGRFEYAFFGPEPGE